MNKILVVYGEGNTGKTTVVNDIYNELINKGAAVVVARKKIGGDINDFTGVLEYKGKKIGFLSMGDFRKKVDEYVSKYKKYDIFITALNKCFADISTVWLENSNMINKFEKISANNGDNKNVKNAVISQI